jgi:phosphoribosylanthranilate isomerase
MDDFRHARGILLDAWHEDLYGGSGKTFDWYLLRQPDSQLKKEQGGESGREQPELGDAASRVILAGGLKPDNVAQAIRTVMPWGVDVSSGVESAPGIKSEPLINAFMREVQRVF